MASSPRCELLAPTTTGRPLAASTWCQRSSTRADGCLCCCTSCCTGLTHEYQGGSVRLPLATLAPLGSSTFAGVPLLLVAIDLNRLLTFGQNSGKLDKWAHCSSCAASWPVSLSTAPGRLALGGSHSARLGRQRATSGIPLGVTPAVQCCMLLERSLSSSSSSSFSNRPRSATSGARELPALRDRYWSLARPVGTYALVTRARRSWLTVSARRS